MVENIFKSKYIIWPRGRRLTDEEPTPSSNATFAFEARDYTTSE
jgi:hypothetical protein